jgi:hypothetical protein
MNNTEKTALIVVWMGKLPSYFPLWVRSLRVNSAFDFFLFTDQTVETPIPGNLKIVRLSFDDLRKRIDEQLSLKTRILHPYKLCDFKPAYGEIFRDYLAGYRYWGNCDMDVLFGDLGKFITPGLLASYKKLFSRGHLTIYHNEPSINAAYRNSTSIDHKKILTSPEVYLFDEWSGIHRIFEELQIGQYNAEIMGDIKVLSSRIECTNIRNYKPQVFVWQNGDVRQYYIDGGGLAATELAYIHFQKRKISIEDPAVYTSPVMVLNPGSVLAWDGVITPALVKKYDRPGYTHYLGSVYKKIKKKIYSDRGNVLSINKTLVQARP